MLIHECVRACACACASACACACACVCVVFPSFKTITYGILRFRQLQGGGEGEGFLAQTQKIRLWLTDVFEIWYQ